MNSTDATARANPFLNTTDNESNAGFIEQTKLDLWVIW
jgi:hypothetical protein